MNFFLFFLLSTNLFATQPNQKTLPIGLAPFEKEIQLRQAPLTPPPPGPVISLAEWEVSKGVMTLWSNPSLLHALHENGPLYLFADSNSEKSWWSSWLNSNSISEEGIHYFTIPTNSIWIRDYGPWFILDGNRNFGIIDTQYNRPRPLDDVVPQLISQELEIPYYQPGLVHTGGNYYNDALGNAFSSTLIFSENRNLSKELIFDRMLKYLGIERYTTSRLSPGSTIQHIDTFGKLVSPDTWVFSEFPSDSLHKTDSDNMVSLLQTLKSPYGTPYKIYRLKMIPFRDSGYRAYLNSFISNGVLYYPQYGDSIDEEARAIYQKALPGYKIVGVDALGTEWGDSVHCRTRNLLSNDALFLFPHLNQVKNGRGTTLQIQLEAIPSPGARLITAPVLNFSINDVAQATVPFSFVQKTFWQAAIPDLNAGDKLRIWITAEDSKGIKRSEPRFAPAHKIELEIERSATEVLFRK